MLWTIFIILLVLWLLGLVSGTTFGGFIHILLVLAIAVVLIRVIQGRRPVERLSGSVRPGAVVGALLILAGVIMFSVGGFSFRSKERVAEVGPVEVTAERKRSVAVPPVLAGLAVIGGLVLIVASRRRAG